MEPWEITWHSRPDIKKWRDSQVLFIGPVSGRNSKKTAVSRRSAGLEFTISSMEEIPGPARWCDLYHRRISMNINAIDEVLYIVNNCIREESGLVSLRYIENYILEYPGLFPFFSKFNQRDRRNLISRIMNARYEIWNDSRRTKIRNRVWDLRKKKGLK
jgi:hypothetical protein